MFPATEEAVALFKEFGRTYTVDQLSDPHFLYTQLAELGYSCSITSTTEAEYLLIREKNGVLGDPEMVKSLRANGGVLYTYQLLGPTISSRGAHHSSIAEHPVQALLLALYFIIMLDKKAETS